MNLKHCVAAAMFALCALAPQSAYAAPAATVDVCITDFRVLTNNPRHALFGYGRVRDGRGFQFYMNATDLYGQVYSGAFSPASPGAGTGYIAGQEPELVRFLERAANDGAWLRISLDASTGALQKASSIARTYPRGAACA